ncbi:hypothetical protein ACFYWH_29980 [Streptomyces sp. NPDC003737]|uniref:hypothetical protein n=1 Tax=Streptomyces sp. NPDC003737 TaxID=3364685 RepID=UPI00368A5C01
MSDKPAVAPDGYCMNKETVFGTLRAVTARATGFTFSHAHGYRMANFRRGKETSLTHGGVLCRHKQPQAQEGQHRPPHRGEPSPGQHRDSVHLPPALPREEPLIFIADTLTVGTPCALMHPPSTPGAMTLLSVDVAKVCR